MLLSLALKSDKSYMNIFTKSGSLNPSTNSLSNMKKPPESPPVIEIEDGVNERIESTVDVSQPGDEIHHSIGGTARRTKWYDDIHEEKGEPTNDKHTHYNPQRSSSSSLF